MIYFDFLFIGSKYRKVFSFLIPSNAMGKKLPDISPRKIFLQPTGQREAAPNRMEIRKLINRLRDSYLEMTFRYQRLDKSYRNSMAIINKGNHSARRGNKSRKMIG